jgi:hypothetical protein
VPVGYPEVPCNPGFLWLGFAHPSAGYYREADFIAALEPTCFLADTQLDKHSLRDIFWKKT